MTDAELIVASRTDPKAFRELCDRWAERVLAASTGIEEPRGSRYEQGCAIFVGAAPVFEDGRTPIEAELWQRGPGG